MYNVRKKCIEKILWGKTEASLKFDKSFLWQLKLAVGYTTLWFSQIQQKHFFLLCYHFFVSCDAPIYTENFA